MAPCAGKLPKDPSEIRWAWHWKAKYGRGVSAPYKQGPDFIPKASKVGKLSKAMLEIPSSRLIHTVILTKDGVLTKDSWQQLVRFGVDPSQLAKGYYK